MHNLAVLMSEGVDGAPDRPKALQWFLAAANYGVKDSQYNLGVIYARGLGTPPTSSEAYKWFAIAAAQGDGDAATRRDEVAEHAEPRSARQGPRRRRAPGTPSRRCPRPTPSRRRAAAGTARGGVTEADQRALVMKIQTLLAEQGYDPGPADGVAGPKTRDAVRAFQRTIGVAETGQIDSDPGRRARRPRLTTASRATTGVALTAAQAAALYRAEFRVAAAPRVPKYRPPSRGPPC